MATMRENRPYILLILLALIFVYLQGWMLGDWIVDDAGISIAYARNLIEHGMLVSQIGAERVEGYSNPLWVLLMACIGYFGPILSYVKIISALLLSWSIFRLYFGLRRLEVPISAIISVLFLIAFQPAIIIWSFSGLENSLYLAAGIELLLRMCFAAAGKAKRKDIIIAGVACSALALTRPEGIMYAPLYVGASLINEFSGKTLRKSSISLAIPIFFMFSYSVFRWHYFNSILPNPYYAKGGPRVSYLFEILFLYPHPISKLLTLSRTIFGEILQAWGMIASLAIVSLAFFRSQDRKFILVLLLFISTTLLAYLLLPSDWMPEARYATLFYPAYFLLMIDCIHRLMARKWILFACLVVLFAGTFSIYRINFFSLNPTISINEVQDRSDRFARWGRLFNKKRCSILTADGGGYLLRNDLDLIDLGMLCDRTIAQTLGEGSKLVSRQRFYNYIFEERKPSFIEIRAYHTWLANLDGDKRFRRDYIPIREYTDLWVKQKYSKRVSSGDFIRREIANINTSAIEKIRLEATSIRYPFCGELNSY